MSNAHTQQSDTPDAPPEVLARQAKSRALTPQTAELIGAKEYVDDAGHTQPFGQQTMTKRDEAARSARMRAEAFVGGTPHAGIDPAKVALIKGRNYPDAPAMDVELGDRTPAFVNWLFATHPEDAKIRYAYRDIWPTSLPAEWPPIRAKKTEAAAPRRPRKVPSRAKPEAAVSATATPTV